MEFWGIAMLASCSFQHGPLTQPISASPGNKRPNVQCLLVCTGWPHYLLPQTFVPGLTIEFRLRGDPED